MKQAIIYKEIEKGEKYFDIFHRAMELRWKYKMSILFRKKKLEAYEKAEDIASNTVLEIYPDALKWSAAESSFDKNTILLSVLE